MKVKVRDTKSKILKKYRKGTLVPSHNKLLWKWAYHTHKLRQAWLYRHTGNRYNRFCCRMDIKYHAGKLRTIHVTDFD